MLRQGGGSIQIAITEVVQMAWHPAGLDRMTSFRLFLGVMVRSKSNHLNIASDVSGVWPNFCSLTLAPAYLSTSLHTPSFSLRYIRDLTTFSAVGSRSSRK